MIASAIWFKGHSCFRDQWSGFERFTPITVVIGRNNSGKSHLLDLVDAECSDATRTRGWDLRIVGTLEKHDLTSAFGMGVSGGHLPGNHWQEHGTFFEGALCEVEFDAGGTVSASKMMQEERFNKANFGLQRFTIEARRQAITKVLSSPKKHRSILTGRKFVRLTAERNIRPESPTGSLELAPDGANFTNIVRRISLSTEPNFDRTWVSDHMLNGLNEIFANDGRFTEIAIRHHDTANGGGNEYEVYLNQPGKGLIALSKSGSGLKTVLLVLLALLVVPKIENKDSSHYVYGFEEVENHIHPALLRRLLGFVAKHVEKTKCSVIFTTHSSVLLDYFGTASDAQVIHVQHDGKTARTDTVKARLSAHSVIYDLGVKPSDLLHAQGVIWVEGPSDRIYLNKWIQLISEGTLREGRDYQLAFFGGALLSHIQYATTDDELEQFANLLRLNHNVAFICDSDIQRANAKLKSYVQRVVNELEKFGGFSWVTSAKEIENYIPLEAFNVAFAASASHEPEKMQRFFPGKGAKAKSFWNEHTGRKTYDKVEIALKTSQLMTLGTMQSRFDWLQKMTQLVKRIEDWKSHK